MTIFKTYGTRKGAENYIAKFWANDSEVRIEEVGDRFFVVAGYSGYDFANRGY